MLLNPVVEADSMGRRGFVPVWRSAMLQPSILHQQVQRKLHFVKSYWGEGTLEFGDGGGAVLGIS